VPDTCGSTLVNNQAGQVIGLVMAVKPNAKVTWLLPTPRVDAAGTVEVN
jgi:hypothetical protein